MEYILHTPTGKEMNFALRFGSISLKHGDIVPESELTRAYPEFFRPVVKTETKAEKVTTTEVITEIVPEVKTEVVEKRKVGRPKKNFGK